MLFPNAVTPKILGLIKSLQQKEYLKDFHLAGGTALALYWGHRKSIDIDLFCDTSFNAAYLLEEIQQEFTFELFLAASNTLKGSINNIKVDFIAHRYPYVESPVVMNGINLLHEHDILAMKLNAISISGQRSKDFIDIWYAFTKYEISDMIGLLG